MQWFSRCAIQSYHFKTHYRTAAPFPLKIRRWMVGVRQSAFSSDQWHEQEHGHDREQGQLSFESGLAISVQVDC
jgi:ribosomal protein L37E